MPFRKTLDNTQSAYGAVSKGTTDQAGWAKYFGQPNKNYQISRYDENDRSTWTLPDAYSNGSPDGSPNQYLATTFEELAFFAENWYTRIALPLERTNKTGIAWERFEFDGTITGVVPERGVTRIVHSSRTEGSASFIRRGLGFRLEHGFMNTELGRRHYQANIAQINRAVQETNNFGVIYALLTCDDYNAEYERQNGYYRGKEVKNVLENDVFLWDILKQQKNGMYVLDTWVRGRMDRYKGLADMWIVTPEVTQYLTQVPEEATDYWLSGARGPNTLVDGVDSFTNFRNGQRIYVTRTYDVDKEGPVDPMVSPSQIGEYYISKDVNRGGDYKGYRSIWRSIQIYDEDNDKFETLDLKFLLKNCARHGPDGKLMNINDDNVRNFNARFNSSDIASDFLHYEDVNGDLQAANYMGQTKINLDDVLDVSRSILDNLPLTTKDGASLHKTFYDGMRAVELIESLRYDDENVEKFFENISLALGVAVDNKSLKAIILKEYPRNSYGSLDLPVLPGDNNKKYRLPLPPGYANYAGFKTIAAKSKEGKAAVEGLGFEFKWFNIVSDFVDLIDDIVSKLRMYLPNSIVLDRKYASPWWVRPNAQTVFFENIITKHRYPLWLSKEDVVLESSIISAALGDDVELKEKWQINDFNAIIKPYEEAFDVVIKNYANKVDLEDDYVKNLPTKTVVVNAKVKDAVKTLAEVAFQSYILSLSKLKSGDGNKVENTNNINRVYDAIIKNNKTVGDIGLDGYANKLLQLIDDNNELLRKKALKNIRGTFGGILEEINNLRKSSHADKSKPALDFRIEGDDDEFKHLVLDNFHRSPLTGSPALFVSILETIKAGVKKPKVLPSSPNNPNRAINGVEASEFSSILSEDMYFESDKIPATLKPLNVSEAIDGYEVSHIAACINTDNYNNMDELSRDADVELNSNIGALYGDEYDFDDTNVGHSGILSIHGNNRRRSSYGRRSVIREDREPIRKKRSRAMGFGVRSKLDIDDTLTANVSSHNFVELFNKINNEADDPLVKLFGLAFLFTPTDHKNFDALIRYNIVFPWNFLVFRPHARYLSQAVIKMKAGNMTGATYMGNSHFTLGDDALTQEHVGSYTYYSKSIVYQPKHVYVVRNAYVNGYEGGMGVKPYSPNDDYNPIHGNYGNGSVFVIAIPRYETKFPNPLSITGEFHYFEHNIDELKENNKIHYSTAPYYNRLYGWQDMGLNGELDLPGLMYGNEVSKPNSIVYLGHTRRFDSVNKRYSIIEAGTGHWKAGNTYIGCAKARKGLLTAFETFKYN